MQSKRLSTILVGSAVIFGVTYTIASPQRPVSKPDGGDWLYVDHDFAGTRYSPLTQINTKNVSQLARVCTYSFPDKEPSQTAPIVSAGIMYLTTAHYTVALDGSDSAPDLTTPRSQDWIFECEQ
jgi:glucose dehydrogenase